MLKRLLRELHPSLHIAAAKNGFLKIVKSLLKHGVSYNIENKADETPFDLSKDTNIANLLRLVDKSFKNAKDGNFESIGWLREVKHDEFVCVTNARNNQGNTLLQVPSCNN